MQRLYSLEVLRFMAAACIFFGHYVHFYMYFNMPENAGIFYKINPSWGGLAVPLFFMMSGAIFTHNYLNQIVVGGLKFWTYVRRRWARLYPLHVVTLILVACLQLFMLNLTGKFFIYEMNDIYHFVLNLFFASNWGLEKGNSFNGPVWSVSHEVLLYLLFFLACVMVRYFKSIYLVYLFFISILAIGISQTNHFVLKSAFLFFFGGLEYLIIQKIYLVNPSRKIKLFLFLCLFLSLYLLRNFFKNKGAPYGFYEPLILALCLILDHEFRIREESFIAKFAVFFGGISYSTYLLHFPIQIALVIFSLKIFQIDFSENTSLSTYLFLVFACSIYSYFKFEKPLQVYLLSDGKKWKK